jgi:hypothetical protein
MGDMQQVEPSRLWDAMRRSGHTRGTLAVPPGFSVGCWIRTRNINPLGHTRLPRYLRGKTGRIERYLGVFRFADDYARDLATVAHVYAVRFDGREIWGPDAEQNIAVYLDVYEQYILEQVEGHLAP